MLGNLIVPPYQIALIRKKPDYGVALTETEESLVNSGPQYEEVEYFKYLKEIHPARFQALVLNTQVQPVTNYRESYTASALLEKAYSAGFIPSTSELPGFSEFKSSYNKSKIFQMLKSYLPITSSILYTAVFGFPKFASLPSFVFQNLSVFAIAYYGLSSVELSVQKQLIQSEHHLAQLKKEELFKLNESHQILWKFENPIEEFPPNLYCWRNHQFLSSKSLYDKAHEDEFNGINRRKSQYVLYKEHRDQLP